MKSLIYLFILFFLSIGLCFGTYKVLFWVGEHYFFDRLFYKKSTLFGYDPYEWNYSIDPSTVQLEIRERMKDLGGLLDTNGKVLGDSNAHSEYRIAVIGDSFVYGTGVREKDRFTHVLSEMFNNANVEIRNYGQVGDDIIDNYIKYKLSKNKEDPNLFIFGLVDNDLVIEAVDKYPGKEQTLNHFILKCKNKNLIRHTELFDQLSWEGLIDNFYLPSISTNSANLCLLNQIVQKIDNNNVIYFVMSESNISGTEYDRKEAVIFDTYSSVIKENGGYVLNPFDSQMYPNSPGYHCVSEIECHPNEETHKWYATVLVKELRNNPKWNF